jgi:hypothetical protein
MLRRVPALLVLAVGLGVFLLFGPKIPRDQAVGIVLGDAAATVREVTVRYRLQAPSTAASPQNQSDRGELTDEVLREVSFRFPRGGAPRVVRHEPRLADGDYLLEIELVTDQSRTTVTRAVGLLGGATSVDVSRVLAALSADGGSP